MLINSPPKDSRESVLSDNNSKKADGKMNQALSGLKNAKSVVGFMQTYEVNSDEKNSGIFETHGKKRMYS